MFISFEFIRDTTKDTGSPLAGRALAYKPVPFRRHAACCMKPLLHLLPGLPFKSQWPKTHLPAFTGITIQESVT
jgi:hypothetical protein